MKADERRIAVETDDQFLLSPPPIKRVVRHDGVFLPEVRARSEVRTHQDPVPESAAMSIGECLSFGSRLKLECPDPRQERTPPENARLWNNSKEALRGKYCSVDGHPLEQPGLEPPDEEVTDFQSLLGACGCASMVLHLFGGLVLHHKMPSI